MGELFNTKENELINRIKKMKPLCRGVLVVERFKKSWYANVPEDAWYALDHRKDMTVKIDGYTAPLITPLSNSIRESVLSLFFMK